VTWKVGIQNMGRRGNNEGTILKRKTCRNCKKVTSTSKTSDLITCKSCGSKLPNECTFITQATLGIDPRTGKSKRKSFYGKTRKEAVDKMNKALQDINKGGYIEPTKYKFEDWLDKWLENYNKDRLKASTYDSYESRVRIHIKPDLGKIPLGKLQTNTLQEFYNKKLKDGRFDGKGGLSERAVRHLHTIISLSLDQAVLEKLVPINVAKATKPPKVKNKKMRTLTEAEIFTFIESVKDDKFYTAYIVAITTGVRRGELLGLCWDCVDLVEGRITVERQLLALKEGITLDDGTKSKLSKRAITLTKDAINELKKHRVQQEKVKKWLTDSGYIDHNLVFARDDGSFLDPREFTKRFQRKLKKAGLPIIRLHDIRHTHASMLLADNVHPKIVQERLGHSSINVTLDLYSHLSEGIQRRASDSLDDLFAKKKDSDQSGQDE
jgi:integrase